MKKTKSSTFSGNGSKSNRKIGENSFHSKQGSFRKVLDKNEILKLELKAADTRKEILQMIVNARGTHIASSFSIVEILIYLYDKILEINPSDPKNSKRDKFVLSKGHGCAALYVVLANKGFFPKKVLETYCTPGSILGGHPDSTRIPGVETSTGSLGHGFSVAVGFALSNKINNIKSKVYCLVGDGECNEGSIWEGVAVASHHKLDNLVLILDDNKLLISGFAKDILDPLSFSEKFKAFGWNTLEIDGHDFSSLKNAFNNLPFKNNKPTIIIANTIKGKGISFMENKKEWYSMLPNEEEMKTALSEIDERIISIKRQLKK